ncbi:hypothetical protein PROVRETT_08242 [Providencia rettgeri DSM 1131]|nr:hypothetical protein PROVRETT_08242 [Providencia rettgeri DSM 1131]
MALFSFILCLIGKIQLQGIKLFFNTYRYICKENIMAAYQNDSLLYVIF